MRWEEPGEFDDAICLDDIEPIKYYKFDLTEDDLKNKLPRKYNTFSANVQAADSFRHEMMEILVNALTPLDFYQQLIKRRKEKLREYNRRYEHLISDLFAEPDSFDPDPGGKKWAAAARFFKYNSFETLLGHFSSIRPEIDEDYVYTPPLDIDGEETPPLCPPSPRIYDINSLPGEPGDYEEEIVPPTAEELHQKYLQSLLQHAHDYTAKKEAARLRRERQPIKRKRRGEQVPTRRSYRTANKAKPDYRITKSRQDVTTKAKGRR